MQWEGDRDTMKDVDTPTAKSQGGQNKRKLLNCLDSGLGSDELPKVEDEFSLYDEKNSAAGGSGGFYDHESRDSGCDGYLGAGALQAQSPSWLHNEESMDFTNLDINLKEQLPSDFEMLITGKMDDKGLRGSPDLRRSVSLNADAVPVNKLAFGKTETVGDFRAAKRSKGTDIDLSIQRSWSFNEDHIKDVLQKSLMEPDLVGDFSRAHTLPLTTGRHQDLKCITASTLAALIGGEFNNGSLSYKIIDCRYPYEFNGGHITGAVNLYTRDQIVKLLHNRKNFEQILIFHCEFSSERGPGLCRFLRQMDRNMNEYPQLIYPEMYLLHGGYKGFFENFIDLCEPKGYKPMLHPDHQADLHHFKYGKSLSEDNLRSNNRGRFKRLGLDFS